jgi:hypothetical protein
MGEDRTFKPTVEWMARKYDEMNNWLFNGQLGKCDFDVFTTGRGSQGSVLGWFKITGDNIYIDRGSRRMYVGSYFSTVRTYIDRYNFVRICCPKIELNGNYSGLEKAFLATLVHEMCHYYTYMYGYAPKQGHGREFKDIGAIVSSRSEGMFTIQRLASAEDMSNLDLSDEMKAKNEKRLENKKSNIVAIFDFRRNGQVCLTTTSNKPLIEMIVGNYDSIATNKIIVSNDKKLIDFLFSKGYTKNLRTWRYWYVENKDWLNTLGDYEIDEYINPRYKERYSGQNLSIKRSQPKIEPQPPKEKRIFSIKTSNGVFEKDVTDLSINTVFDIVKERFPNMKDEVIEKIIANKANYKTLKESKDTLNNIITEVIQDYFGENENNGENEDSIRITPNMNLGLYSPLEME